MMSNFANFVQALAVLLTCISLSAGQGGTFVGSRQGVYNCQCPTNTAFHRECSAKGVALYTMTFNAKWTEPRPRYNILQRWSSMIGATHTPCSVFWRQGSRASSGMQSMANVRVPTLLEDETTSRIDSRTAFKTEPLGAGVGTVETKIEVDKYHHVVSSVAFMQPSPDWFVGLDSVSLCREHQWLEEATFDLQGPWDAGVRSGLTFIDFGQYRLTTTNRIFEDSSELSSSFLGFTGSLGSVAFKLQSINFTAGDQMVGRDCPVCETGCNSPAPSFACPQNEEFSANAPQAPLSCDMDAPDACIRPTKPGCMCSSGYARNGTSPNSPCVPISNCRSLGAMSPAKLCKVTNAFRPECVGESRRSVKFYEVCQETYSTSCTFPCAELRCNCLEGYSRTAQGICKKDAVVSISGERIDSPTPPVELGCSAALNEQERSSTTPTWEQACGNNPTCQHTCEGAEGGKQSCRMSCLRGCFCLPGYLRHRDGRCVTYTGCFSPSQNTSQQEEPTTSSGSSVCPVNKQCAHFHPLGSACCPECRQTISSCANIKCPPEPGCTRYASEVEEGQCCLKCIRKRKRINDGPCAAVKCALGQQCVVEDGSPVCVCKKCNDLGPAVTGTDGRTYTNTCHRLRASCLACRSLIP